MKKFTAILLTLILAASITACSGGNSSTGSSSETPSSSSSESSEKTPQATETQPETEAPTEKKEIEKGDSGEGEKELDSVFCNVTIPEGLKYKVYFYSYDETPLGTLQIDFGKKYTTEGRLEVSTTRMIKSLDDAVEECIRVRNIESYTDGKYEIGEEKTFGDTTYKQVNFSQEFGSEACLVSYYKRADGKDIYVEIGTKNNGLSNLEITDPLVEELAKSAVYK
ncbi:MAG: hypothetical protein ACI4F2_10725 [Acutalibacteraceae bacterium]